MSWWDTSGFSNLASQALKNAQKKIDKVLDIDAEEASSKRKGSHSSSKSAKTEEDKEQGGKKDGDFWSGLLGAGGKTTQVEEEGLSQTTHSSWSLPWSLTPSGSEQLSGHSSGSKPTSDVSSPVSDPLSSVSKTSSDTKKVTSAEDAKKKQDSLTDHSLAEIKSEDVETDTRSAHSGQKSIAVSDSFNADWQDFPMDSSLEMRSTDRQKTGDIQETDITSPVKDIVKSTTGIKSSSESDSKERNLGKNIDDNSSHDVDTSARPLQMNIEKSSANSRLSPVQGTSEKTQIEIQADLPHSKDLSAESKLSQDEPNQLNVQQEDNSLKTSTSSSFAALSDESISESFLSSSSYASLHQKDIHPQGSSTPIGVALQEVEEAKEVQPSDVTDESNTAVKADSGVESGDVASESSHVNIQQSLQSETPSDSTDTGIGTESDTMVTSEYKSSQSDFMQEYVNVSTISEGSQAVSFDGSAISSDDLLHTSTEMEMGNSRTSSDLDLPGGRASSTGSSDTSKFDSSIDTVVDQRTLDSQSDIDMEKDPPYSLFGESKLSDSDMGASAASEAGLLGDDSYVKCMIEEAMEDLSRTEDSGSDNHSNGEKSESSKVDSEMEKSIYSGHESSDEIETTTSSDIEIISAPTPNGDNKYHTPFDLSPLKIALQRTVRDQGHHRSDSQSSSSAHSKAGEIDRLSPERGEGATWREEDYHHHDLHSVQEEGADNPYHPEKLLKKLAEMAEVLQARESKLIQLSKDNHQLVEDNNILRNQLQQSEDARESETADLKALTDEFTIRIGEAEKKMQAVLKEKESLKQRLASAEKELERRSQDSDLEAMLEEKREQVEELLKEGEKLSKQQLQSSNIIKKLRAKEKENDATITSQKKKLDEQAKELERLTTVLDSKEEMEKKQSEAINQLNAAVQRQEKELVKIKSELEDAVEKSRGLQAALDNSYKEIAELHRSNASQDSKAQERALSAEAHVREELKAAMEREQQRFRQEREAFIMQADDLRMDMARLEKEHSRREDLLREEIAHLQERLQQDEARSQDLTQSVTSATRPLLRQIENLQATYGAQSNAWERVEKNLTDRLAEAQTALAMAQEKERNANERHMELSAKVTSIDAANSRLKQEKAQLTAELESNRSKLEELQDARNSVVAQLETGKQKLSQELSQLKMDKVHLESQLNVERTRLENEKKKTSALEEQLRLAERPRSRGTPSPSPSMSVSRQDSLAGSMYERHSPALMSWSLHEDESGSTIGGSKTSVYENLRQSGAAIVVENLSSQLKLREGELTHLQSEIAQLERTRESMARELVNLTNQNEELQEVKKAHEQLQEQYNELNSRYSAILQMYGEKEEQVQELRLDLQDVKEMYKSQIDALLAK